MLPGNSMGWRVWRQTPQLPGRSHCLNSKVMASFHGGSELIICHPVRPPMAWQVVCVEDGLPTWVCELMVSKPTIDEAIAVGDAAVRHLPCVHLSWAVKVLRAVPGGSNP